MKEIFVGGIKIFGKLVIVTFMCFFLVISFNVFGNALFTENIGYTAYGTLQDSEESVELYEYYFADGEDLKRADFEAQGYTISEISIKSQMTKLESIGLGIVYQIFALIILITFIYTYLWQLGTKDSNFVHYNHKKEDKLKGLKMGAIAIIPSVLFLSFFVITKNGLSQNFPIAIYRFINSYAYSFIEWSTNSAMTFKQLGIGNIVLLYIIQLIVPITAFVSYLLGYKNIMLSEKILYIKKK